MAKQRRPVRTLISLKPEQHAWLHRQAAEIRRRQLTGSVAGVVRTALDEVMAILGDRSILDLHKILRKKK